MQRKVKRENLQDLYQVVKNKEESQEEEKKSIFAAKASSFKNYKKRKSQENV